MRKQFKRWQLLKAATATEALVDGWISRFVVPAGLTSDRGTHFTSHLWNVLYTRLDINHITSTAFHPCSNRMMACSNGKKIPVF